MRCLSAQLVGVLSISVFLAIPWAKIDQAVIADQVLAQVETEAIAAVPSKAITVKPIASKVEKSSVKPQLSPSKVALQALADLKKFNSASLVAEAKQDGAARADKRLARLTDKRLRAVQVQSEVFRTQDIDEKQTTYEVELDGSKAGEHGPADALVD